MLHHQVRDTSGGVSGIKIYGKNSTAFTITRQQAVFLAEGGSLVSFMEFIIGYPKATGINSKWPNLLV